MSDMRARQSLGGGGWRQAAAAARGVRGTSSLPAAQRPLRALPGGLHRRESPPAARLENPHWRAPRPVAARPTASPLLSVGLSALMTAEIEGVCRAFQESWGDGMPAGLRAGTSVHGRPDPPESRPHSSHVQSTTDRALQHAPCAEPRGSPPFLGQEPAPRTACNRPASLSCRPPGANPSEGPRAGSSQEVRSPNGANQRLLGCPVTHPAPDCTLGPGSAEALAGREPGPPPLAPWAWQRPPRCLGSTGAVAPIAAASPGRRAPPLVLLQRCCRRRCLRSHLRRRGTAQPSCQGRHAALDRTP